jgi:DNA mismatch repair protein MutS
MPMTFFSILFENPEDEIKEEILQAPVYFSDLNLDQVVNAITAGRDEYDLKPFFYDPLKSIGAINYRHEILQEIEDARLSEVIRSFSTKMRTMRAHLAQAEKLITTPRRNASSWMR